MSAPSPSSPLLPSRAPTPERALGKLFLTLFLRGRAVRGLKKAGVPKSVGWKLKLILGFYAFAGCMALTSLSQPVFTLAIYLHAMTLLFLGTYIASSAGEMLFNKEEADILGHRPVTSKALLRAKIQVLLRMSLWMAGAFNLVGFFVGVAASDGGWFFPVSHAFSTVLQALFCTGSVVLVYQLCLRWFGRERLDTVMTAAQVLMTVGFVVGSQVAPQLIARFGRQMHVQPDAWWMWLLPPAWFAGLDDALAGSHGKGSWAMAVAGVLLTVLVLWLAFGKLAQTYGAGLQAVNEATGSTPGPRKSGRGLLSQLVHAPPLRWWLRDSVSRASFLLATAYLMRDRDTKLRVFPGLAPMLVMPLIPFFSASDNGGAFSGLSILVPFSSCYLGILPLVALGLLETSQQWRAAEIFRAAPTPGPASLCHGARVAVMCLLVLPALLLYGVILWLVGIGAKQFALMLPGLILLPVYALIPCLRGHAVPISQPPEGVNAAGRGLRQLVVMFVSLALGGVSLWAFSTGWFVWFLLGEALIAAVVYLLMSRVAASVRWSSLE